MNKSKKLAALFSGTLLVSMMFASSAFADSRHRDETRDESWRNRDSTQRTFNATQSHDRNNGTQRSFNSTQSHDRYNGRESQSRYSYSGRVSRVESYHGGYRVWVGAARYPFFIASGAWGRWPLRVGVNVSLGGYYNPAYGYYNVYNYGPYGNPYAYSTAGDIHGVIESVDYRRGTAVIRDDISGAFITVALRGNDPRLGNLRPGDYADLSGSWNRAGVFNAYNVADLRPAGGGYGYGDRDRDRNDQYPPQYPPSQYPQ
jgi:hypothetical protein